MRANRLKASLPGFVAIMGLAVAAWAGPPPPAGVFEADFNGDGKDDMARQNAGGIRVDILDGTSSIANGTFATGGGVFTLKAVGNENNDANADLIAQGGGTIRVTFVNAAGTGPSATPQLFIPDGGGAWGVVDAADVDGDGIDEIICYGSGGAAGAVRITNVATGTPVHTFLSTANSAWVYKFAADVNGDHKMDLVFTGTGVAAGTSRANLNGSTTAKFYAQGGDSWTLTGAGDVDGNGTADLVDTGANVAAAGFNRVRTLDTNGDPTGSAFVGNAGNAFVLKRIGDFTGDGKADLGYQNAGSFRITPMNGLTIGAPIFPPNGGGQFTLRRMSDTNGDGLDDLIVTNASNDVRIQLSTGSATTQGPLIPNGGLTLFVSPPAN
jgi:hypothetical protein